MYTSSSPTEAIRDAIAQGAITEAYQADPQQVAAYTTLVRELCERDPTTRRLLVEILADTERHARS